MKSVGRIIKGTLGLLSLIVLTGGFLGAYPPLAVASSPADPVLEWDAIMNDTVLAGATSPFATSRVAAMVSASVFDAVNGIRPRYKPLRVRPAAPRYASQRAAAVQAAYEILIKQYPAQIASLTTRHDASIAAIASSEGARSIQAGITWGQSVADSIWAS